MWCRTVRRLLGDFADGTLPSRKESGVRKHLHRCPACREREEEIRMVGRALSRWRDAPAPEDGLHRLETRLAFSPPPPVVVRRGTVRSLVLPYVAGLATAASLMLAVWQPWGGETPQAPVDTNEITTTLTPDVKLPKGQMMTIMLGDGRLVEVPVEWADPLLDEKSREQFRSRLPKNYGLIDHEVK